jgi:hypothetical protein
MIDFWKLRTELRILGSTDLLKIAAEQKEHNCVLNPGGPCPFYFRYKGFGFCVSELSGQGCQADKARQGGEMQRLLPPTLKLKRGGKGIRRRRA